MSTLLMTLVLMPLPRPSICASHTQGQQDASATSYEEVHLAVCCCDSSVKTTHRRAYVTPSTRPFIKHWS